MTRLRAREDDVMSDAGPAPTSFGRRISDLASDPPPHSALVFASRSGEDRVFSHAELERRSLQIAALLRERGVGQGSMVVIGLPNSPEHVFAAIACWKLGACVLPLRHDLPAWERDRLIRLAKPRVAIGAWPDVEGSLCLADLVKTENGAVPTLEDRVADPANAIASSGSTGQPKLILRPGRGERIVGDNADTFVRDSTSGIVTELVPAPLYHTNGFFLTHFSLFNGDRVVLMERFDAAQVVDLIERYRVNVVTMVSTMLLRVARVPKVAERDFSSIGVVLQGGAPCPDWLVRFWIGLVGSERFLMSYGSTENVGMSFISGAQWLEHPGSVGKSEDTDVRILDEEGRDLPPREVGEVFMRRKEPTEPTFEYVGASPPRRTEDGFTSIGDMGWLDEDDYLYIADRRVDMIVTGGANVFPAEVEAALLEHSGVFDAVVIGLPDDEWGQSVHALIQAADPKSPPSEEELRGHCRERISAYKVPKAFELVARLPRSEAGKLNRSALVEERSRPVRP